MLKATGRETDEELLVKCNITLSQIGTGNTVLNVTTYSILKKGNAETRLAYNNC